jgi:hypothetical protein
VHVRHRSHPYRKISRRRYALIFHRPSGASRRIVSVPLRKKIVQGIVTEIKPAADMKSEIKNATFALKKLDKVKSTEFFSKAFMDTVDATALYLRHKRGSS